MRFANALRALPVAAAVLALAAPAAAAASPGAERSAARAATVDLFPIPTADSNPREIVVGPDGNLWFTQRQGHRLGVVSPATGQITEIPYAYEPDDLDEDWGPDNIVSSGGYLWFSHDVNRAVSRIAPGGQIALVDDGSSNDGVTEDLAAAADGGVWQTDSIGEEVRRINGAATHLQRYPADYDDGPLVAVGDGSVWYGDSWRYLKHLTPEGRQVNIPIPDRGAERLNSLAFDAQGRLWWAQFAPGGMTYPARGGTVGYLQGTTPRTISFEGDYLPHAMERGPDGLVYFAMQVEVDGAKTGVLARANPDGSLSYASLGNYRVEDFTFTPDGALWFLDSGANTVGRLAATGLAYAPTPQGAAAPPTTPAPPVAPAPPAPPTTGPVAQPAAPKLALCGLRARGSCRTTVAKASVRVEITVDKRSTVTLQAAPVRKGKTGTYTKLSARVVGKGERAIVWNKRIRGKAVKGQYRLSVTASAGGKRVSRTMLVSL
ncbi:Vgb family protein [Motilibacter aurantiacus]|uniref:Vgb family protein n=1 Tax=Motilibacter aurantiacus TaxID=2714955 RepID=UPI00140DBDFC|nr:hypothetical protein [Motilibacter aurantiacus]NHC45349.1 hypothetical protein [Motilibacter aurantiacus]